MICLFLVKHFRQNFKMVCLLLILTFLASCAGTDPNGNNDNTGGGNGSGGGGNPPPTVVVCTGIEANHPNNPGCIIIPDDVPYKGLTEKFDSLPKTPADWGNTGLTFDNSVNVPGHSGSISLLSLPLEINNPGRGALNFNIVGDTDNLYLVTETTQDADLSFDLLFVKKDMVEGKFWGITVKDVDYKHPTFTDVPKGTVEGGNFYWEIKNPLSSTPDAYASLGAEGEYFIYMIITRYDISGWDDLIKGKNVIKIK